MIGRAPSPHRAPRTSVALVLATCVVWMALGCDDPQRQPATLVVSLETDMALPDEVDEVHVQVQSGGVAKKDEHYRVGAAGEQIPATMILIEGDDPAAAVTIRVAGSKDGELRTYRQAVTTVPADGTSRLVRMPMQWLCKGSAKAIPDANGSPLSQPASTCKDEGRACKAGSCEPVDVDAATLPVFAPELVWGGAATPEQGTCFETLECMKAGKPATPDGDCTIEMPPDDPDHLNVALRVASSGICDATRTSCFVPLDAQSSEGWTIVADTGRIQLPQAACTKLADHSVLGILVSTACDVKTAAHPACGDWSRVPRSRAIEPPTEGASAFKMVTVLPLSGTSKQPCCPLMADSNTLYTCVCDPKNNIAADVLSIDLGEPTKIQRVATLELPSDRKEFPFASAIFDGSLYVAAYETVTRRPLREAAQGVESFQVPGSIYDATSLLGDASTVYMLASGISFDGGRTVEPGSAVKLIALPPNDSQRMHTFDTGGEFGVRQFGQDADALYVANRSRMQSAGGDMLLSSAIVRIDKQSGARSAVSSTQTQPWEAEKEGGYLGVQVSARVFALFESALRPDGVRRVQLHALPRDGSAATGDPTVVFEVDSDPQLTRFQLVGALAGAAIVSRREATDPSASTRPLKSQLILIPAGGGAPRTIANFTDEVVERMVPYESSIYFLSSSGKLFVYPQENLQ